MAQDRSASDTLARLADASLPDEELQALVETYPFFLPGQLLWAARQSPASRGAALYAGHPTVRAGWQAWMRSFAQEPHDATPANEPSEETPDAPPALHEADESAVHALTTDTLEEAVLHTHSAEQGEVVEEVFESHPETLEPTPDTASTETADPLPRPLFIEDYLRYEGVDVSAELPTMRPEEKEQEAFKDEERPATDLMVMRSFTDWMTFFHTQSQEAKAEEESKRALRSMWQKEKLAAALEEEGDEIPEQVFEMAVASLAPDEVVSESLAEILERQGKHARAAEMYRKLSAHDPAKSAYFARKIAALEAQNP